MNKLLKVKPPKAYPPEDGGYLRGNDYSPVGVVILLHTAQEKIPDFLKELAKVSVESGAALAGFLQTENLGIEKIICNIVANPNIRYIVLCGIESAGHHPGQTFEAFMENGIDDKRTIIGAISQTPYLYNISYEAIERFRKQVKLVSLLIEDDRKLRIDPERVKKIINACIQEAPTQILKFRLYDLGAYPEPPIYQKITWRIERPWTHHSEEDAEKLNKIKEMAALRYKKEMERKRTR
ncbi:MAG: tetrahydromethanopterin S-methyltransferase subunit A [Candidatus Bathyarchaeota archaeon]|nr:tetrahydromethanopterin S-methyltransferase subunit A [Candidatus Bathyarchaeota archaeon]